MRSTTTGSAKPNGEISAEILVGFRLRKLRHEKRFSLRALAKRSGLNVNTLSLVENGKSSPSVSTLQQLAQALDVPISSFFESESNKKLVVFTPATQRPQTIFGTTQMQNLGKDLERSAVQPFVVTLEPGAGSGDRMIVHTGHEFVYGLHGKILYTVDEVDYLLTPGDSLLFESYLPHQWINMDESRSQIILILFPADLHDEPGGRHFTNENLNKE